MADVKISGLSSAAALDGTELTVLVQGGVTLQSTAQAIADLSPPPSYPISIAHGGTASGNAQQALNTLFTIGSHNDGDVVQLLTGNVQLAPLVLPPAGVTDFNTRTGSVVLSAADVNGALGLGASNAFLFTDPGINLTTYSNWSLDPLTLASNVFTTITPNNLGGAPVSHGWATDVAPLQNSPNDSMSLTSFNVNLDAAATGFQFGSNGQAGQIITGGYNYGGNGATFGTLRNINLFAGLGNGTDPGTFQGYAAVSQAITVAANITLKNTWSGYDYNLNIDAAAITDPSFNILLLADFSQLPVDVYGYQGIVCQPTIATIKNGHNLNGIGVQPNVTLFEGNSGFFAFSAGGTITTAGTSGAQGYNFTTNITSVPATANIIGFSCFNQITTMAATSAFYGANNSPVITTLNGNFTGFQCAPQIAGGSGQASLYTGGMGAVKAGGGTSVMNLNGLTADGKDSQFAADGVSVNLGGNILPLSGQSVQVKHVLFSNFNMTGAGTVTGTDVLCNVLSPQVNFGGLTDTLAIGPAGLGSAFVGFAGQTGGHGQMDLLSAVIPTAIFADDFTLGEWRNVNCNVINAGYTGVCTSATAFYHEVSGAGLFATTHWGLKVITDGIENYAPRMKVGGGSPYKVSNASVALEVGGTTATFLLGSLTTAQKLALTALNGMLCYDTDLNKFQGYEAGAWVNLV